MNYLLKSKPKNGNKFRNIILVSVFFLLAIFAFLIPSFTKTVFTTSAIPVWKVSSFIKTSAADVYNFFSFQNNLVAKNKNLEDQLNLLNLKVIDYDNLLKENQELKSFLGRKDISNKILSRVLSLPPVSPYDSIVIDVGSEDGAKLGSKVFTSDSIIIGNITNITPHTSLVELYSTGNVKTQVVLERTGTAYEMVGEGGANFTIEAPKDADILWGDVFNYPSLNPSVLGSVYYIDTNSQSAFKTIFIRIPGNVFQSKWVFVEK